MRWYEPLCSPARFTGDLPAKPSTAALWTAGRIKCLQTPSVGAEEGGMESQDSSPAVLLCRRQQAWRGQQPLGAPMFAPNPLQNTQTR